MLVVFYWVLAFVVLVFLVFCINSVWRFFFLGLDGFVGFGGGGRELGREVFGKFLVGMVLFVSSFVSV